MPSITVIALASLVIGIVLLQFGRTLFRRGPATRRDTMWSMASWGAVVVIGITIWVIAQRQIAP